MGSKLPAVVVEARLLVREALKSLMAKNSYCVVCDIGSTAEMSGGSSLADDPKLVILGAQSVDKALTEAVGARKLWPDSKIILLHENLSPGDFQKLMTSEINGCVPLFASPDTLIGTLDLIVTGDVRVMVTADVESPVIQSAQAEKPNLSQVKLRSDGPEHEDVSVSIGEMQQTTSPANGADQLNCANTGPRREPRFRECARLSAIEARILDGVAKGEHNKVIAHRCDITESAVKVHMKSIMGKLGVDNRTQAAIWATKNRR